MDKTCFPPPRGTCPIHIWTLCYVACPCQRETFSGVASPGWGRGGKSLNCIALHCVALRCVALRCVALHCIALHYIALHCITLHYITLIHYITLHYHYIISYANYTYTNQWCINKIFQVLRMRAYYISTDEVVERYIVTAHGINISWSRNYATTQQLLKLRWRNLNYQVKQSI